MIQTAQAGFYLGVARLATEVMDRSWLRDEYGVRGRKLRLTRLHWPRILSMATHSISYFDHEFQNASETTLRFRVIVISNVDRYNSIDGRSFKKLATLCDEANGKCDALVLCSDPKSPYFTAGADVAAVDEPPTSPDQAGAYLLTAALARLRVPVVAVVHGPAIGAGLTLMLLADLVYASARASFRAPFRELAILPELGSSMLLPAAIVRRTTKPKCLRHLSCADPILPAAYQHQPTCYHRRSLQEF